MAVGRKIMGATPVEGEGRHRRAGRLRGTVSQAMTAAGRHQVRRVAVVLASAAAVVLGVVVGGTAASALTSQTITFGPLSNETYGAGPLAISATGGGSGNPVTFSTSTGSVCSVTSNGDSTGSVSVVHSGTCTVLANQAGNGTFAAAPQVSRSFTINKAVLTVTPSPTNQIYGTTASLGANVTGFAYSENGGELTGSPSCTTTATSTSSVAGGPYPVTCTIGTMTDPTGNYTFSFVSTNALTVVPATVTVIANNQTITYGDPDPTFTFHSVGLIGSDSLTASPTCGVAGAHANAGLHSITCSGGSAGSNYTLVYQAGTLHINPKALTVTADNAGISFGDPYPTFTFSTAGFVGSDGFTTAPTCSVPGSPTSVGTYQINCSGGNAGSNYTISYQSGTLTIGTAGVTITADTQTITYGDNDPDFTFSVSGLKNGDTLTTEPTCLVSGNHRDAGSYPIVCSGANSSGNYSYTYVAGTLHVNPAHIDITAQNQTKVYGDADPQFSYDVSGLVAADTLVSGPNCGVSGVHVHVTHYSITCASAGAGSNYTVAYFPGTLNITKAQLTVTGDSAERVYGVANPALSATITGFQNGDTTASLSGSPTLNTPATTSSDPGRYPINVGVGSLASPDYTFTTQAGTLTIDEASVNVVGATVHTGGGLFGHKLTLSATATNAATGQPAPGLTTVFTATNVKGKVVQCQAVTDSSGVASCQIKGGTPGSFKNTTYTVQTLPDTDYLPGNGTGTITK
jgi:MBG domain-containing protein